MAQHLVCTFSDPQIRVDLGIYGTLPGISSIHIFNAHYVVNARIHADDASLVQVEMAHQFDNGKKTWTLTHDQAYAGTEAMIIDTIQGVAPTSAVDLVDKIGALMR